MLQYSPTYVPQWVKFEIFFQIVPGQFVRPASALTSQNAKFAGHLTDDWLLFAGLCVCFDFSMW